jgi:hypothetical protein
VAAVRSIITYGTCIQWEFTVCFSCGGQIKPFTVLTSSFLTVPTPSENCYAIIERKESPTFPCILLIPWIIASKVTMYLSECNYLGNVDPAGFCAHHFPTVRFCKGISRNAGGFS